MEKKKKKKKKKKKEKERCLIFDHTKIYIPKNCLDSDDYPALAPIRQMTKSDNHVRKKYRNDEFIFLTSDY